MMQANTGVRFETKDPLLSQLVKQAEEKCRLNIKNFGGDPVLVEGGGYEKIWLEKRRGWKPSPWAAQCMPAVILPPA